MAILAESMATPNTFATLAVRTFTCLTAGRLPVASVIAPISPPQISFISLVARSMACCRKLKSTPRFQSQHYACCLLLSCQHHPLTRQYSELVFHQLLPVCYCLELRFYH